MQQSDAHLSTAPVELPVLIVSYRAASLLEKCLISVEAFHPGHGAFIWDNTGPDTVEIRQLAARYPQFRWHFSERNIGFAAAVNRLADMIPGRDFLLLNPDAELVAPLTKTLALIGQPGIAAAGPMTADSNFGAPVLRKRRVSRLYRETTPWDVANRKLGFWQEMIAAAGVGGIRGTPFSAKYQAPPEAVTGYIVGGCLAVNGKAWSQLGGFDEAFFLYCEEKEWQYRAVRAGWTIRLADESAVQHPGRGTVGDDSQLRQRSEDLQLANGILFYERLYSRNAAEVYLAWISLLASVKRRIRRSGQGTSEIGDVLVTAHGPADLIDSRIDTAISLEQSGYRVAVVSLQQLGDLPRELPPSIRLVRMAWWWPWPPPGGKLPSAVIQGQTAREWMFSQLLRLRGTRVLHSAASIAAKADPLPLRTQTRRCGCTTLVSEIKQRVTPRPS